MQLCIAITAFIAVNATFVPTILSKEPSVEIVFYDRDAAVRAAKRLATVPLLKDVEFIFGVLKEAALRDSDGKAITISANNITGLCQKLISKGLVIVRDVTHWFEPTSSPPRAYLGDLVAFIYGGGALDQRARIDRLSVVTGFVNIDEKLYPVVTDLKYAGYPIVWNPDNSDWLNVKYPKIRCYRLRFAAVEDY